MSYFSYTTGNNLKIDRDPVQVIGHGNFHTLLVGM